jgi:type I restriction enzyme M protein
MNTSSLVQKVWSFCHILRDDGVGYGDKSTRTHSYRAL